MQKKQTLSPLWACILIGGKSSRMGRPKHLIQHPSGPTWLEVAITKLQPFVERVVIAGRGELPENLLHIDRVEDYPEVVGPLAGIMGAASKYPDVSWLLAACDMPLISEKALSWLVEQRDDGCLAVIPKNGHGQGFVEPLFACYESQVTALFGEIVKSGSLKISDICNYEGICLKHIPPEIENSWTNANTPEDAENLRED